MATPAILRDGLSPDAPKPRPSKPDRLWIHALLLAITFFSTTVVGMRYMANFKLGLFPISSDADIFPYVWAWHHASLFYLGLPFSLTLLSILLTHEFGHYFACRHYGIKATLPYVLPAPSLSGTAGAVIRLRSRVKSRNALIAIGAMGPVAGFAVAFAAACAGILLSHPTTHPPLGLVSFNPPLLLRLLRHLLAPTALASPMLWHPVYVASWIGVLITSLNLVPAGQLDGGHILYAISPSLHRYITWLTIATLMLLGFTCWMGWLLWACLLLIPGMRHPRVNDPEPLKLPLLALGPVCLLMFILCATPRPFNNLSLRDLILTHQHRLLHLLHIR